MIRRLIVPLTAAVVTFHAGHVLAQSAFPAPLPNQRRACECIAISARERGCGCADPERRAGLRRFGVRSWRCAGGRNVSSGRSACGGRRGRRLHEGVRSAARRGGEARQDDQGRERPQGVAGRGLQADRQFRPGRTEDDQICRDQLGQMRNSGADRRPARNGHKNTEKMQKQVCGMAAAGAGARARPVRA